jgi:pimeloyl-ACP methyl ester carboxylesterase
MRGRGKSSPIKNPAGFHMKDYLKDIDEAVKKIGKKVILVGHSMGGILSILYAKKNPGKVKKLILISTPYKQAPSSPMMMVMGLVLMPMLLLKKKIKLDISMMFSKDKVSKSLLEQARKNSVEEPTLVIRESMDLSEHSKLVQELKIPILLVRGTNDYATTSSLYRDLLINLKSGKRRLLEFEGHGHLLIQEDGCEKIFAKILDWL